MGPLSLVPETFLIEAHRVVAPRLPLKSVQALQPDSGNLAQYLQTLQGNDRDRFDGINDFVCRVFPEFRRLNLDSRDDHVTVSFTSKGQSERVFLSHCGTGVEQRLSLASYVIGAEVPLLFLLDEPHSYLHPAGERALIDLIAEHHEHKYVIATHSPVLLNAVSGRDVIFLEGKKVSPAGDGEPRKDHSQILRSLGFHNSDFLLNDRIIFVEGTSDQAIIPQFLRATNRFNSSKLQLTGFPTLGGKSQNDILIREKMLAELGRMHIPRLYLLDACPQDERETLKGTLGGNLKIRFLASGELEDYLLVAPAVASAISEQARLGGLDLEITSETVEKLIAQFRVANADGSLPKGSDVLKKVFWNWTIPYNKETSGALVASKLTVENQPLLGEIAELVGDLFEE
jgi:energy-coupling factor transporter ATP-binding protein EcfA2